MDKKKLELEARRRFSEVNPDLNAKALCGCKAALSARRAWVYGYVTETLKYGDK